MKGVVRLASDSDGTRDVRRAGQTDVAIGQRIKQQRSAKGRTQEELSQSLGVSSQQLQKYENGSNRISASRLVDIAHVLQVNVSTLLVDEGASGDTETSMSQQVGRSPSSLRREPSANEVLELVQVFCRTGNPLSRAKIIEMATFLQALEVQ